MQRNTGIDLLRTGSMLYIVGFWHLLEYTRAIDYQNDLTHRLTWIALATFFFISGYLIGMKGIGSSLPEVLGFYWRRFLRIYPLYQLQLI